MEIEASGMSETETVTSCKTASVRVVVVVVVVVAIVVLPPFVVVDGAMAISFIMNDGRLRYQTSQ